VQFVAEGAEIVGGRDLLGAELCAPEVEQSTQLDDEPDRGSRIE
jgi:hypothetical protein